MSSYCRVIEWKSRKKKSLIDCRSSKWTLSVSIDMSRKLTFMLGSRGTERARAFFDFYDFCLHSKVSLSLEVWVVRTLPATQKVDWHWFVGVFWHISVTLRSAWCSVEGGFNYFAREREDLCIRKEHHTGHEEKCCTRIPRSNFMFCRWSASFASRRSPPPVITAKSP